MGQCICKVTFRMIYFLSAIQSVVSFGRKMGHRTRREGKKNNKSNCCLSSSLDLNWWAVISRRGWRKKRTTTKQSHNVFPVGPWINIPDGCEYVYGQQSGLSQLKQWATATLPSFDFPTDRQLLHCIFTSERCWSRHQRHSIKLTFHLFMTAYATVSLISFYQYWCHLLHIMELL